MDLKCLTLIQATFLLLSKPWHPVRECVFLVGSRSTCYNVLSFSFFRRRWRGVTSLIGGGGHDDGGVLEGNEPLRSSSLPPSFLPLFLSCTCCVWKFLGQGSSQSCNCQPIPQPQLHWIWAATVTSADVTHFFFLMGLFWFFLLLSCMSFLFFFWKKKKVVYVNSVSPSKSYCIYWHLISHGLNPHPHGYSLG